MQDLQSVGCRERHMSISAGVPGTTVAQIHPTGQLPSQGTEQTFSPRWSMHQPTGQSVAFSQGVPRQPKPSVQCTSSANGPPSLPPIYSNVTRPSGESVPVPPQATKSITTDMPTRADVARYRIRASRPMSITRIGSMPVPPVELVAALQLLPPLSSASSP